MIDKGRAFANGARFLKGTNPRANKNAFLANWRKYFGISLKEAGELYEDTIAEMKKLGIEIRSFDAFKAMSGFISDTPVVDPSTVDIGKLNAGRRSKKN